ncbi:50S ribosomal protein L2 [Klebsiella michiganensis]|uniref:50S ribosomal protein L2 n=1 Tax=Klebsiella michiganensis TaxID=1134687 RepID=A0A7H4PGP9_9ENTR|nr:50S ribosomal protein L2 [Klebsiella michiganensis]
MAVVKCKPTSPGRRHVVKVVNPELHKGKPFAPLVEKNSKSGGRNNNGRITTRHIGGGHKQAYRIVDFKRNKDGIPQLLNVLSTIRTAPRTSRWFCTKTVSAVTFWPLKA